jgi:5-formyltetrahydrofolate cyclo-ligase
MTEKATLRRHFTDLRNGLTPVWRKAAEASIRETLFALPAWRDAPVICGYMSVRGELNTLPILQRALAEGKRVALPVTVTGAAEGRMVFRALRDGDLTRLTPARFGIPEPDGLCPALTDRDLTNALMLVPALAFDGEGYRLGYGGGYYDRFLDGLSSAGIPITTVGLAFSVCRAPTLPRESHDRPVDIIIDERSVSDSHGSRNESSRGIPRRG